MITASTAREISKSNQTLKLIESEITEAANKGLYFCTSQVCSLSDVTESQTNLLRHTTQMDFLKSELEKFGYKVKYEKTTVKRLGGFGTSNSDDDYFRHTLNMVINW